MNRLLIDAGALKKCQ